MGLFDHVRMLDVEADVRDLKCASGHAITEWQTKSLDSMMDTYWLWRGKLYGPDDKEGHKGAREIIQRGFDCADDERTFVINEVYRYGWLEHLSDGITISAICYDCDPVFTDPGPSNPRAQAHFPSIEYTLIFIDGLIHAIRPKDVETREMLENRISAIKGVPVLAESNPKVVEYRKWVRKK